MEMLTDDLEFEQEVPSELEVIPEDFEDDVLNLGHYEFNDELSSETNSILEEIRLEISKSSCEHSSTVSEEEVDTEDDNDKVLFDNGKSSGKSANSTPVKKAGEIINTDNFAEILRDLHSTISAQEPWPKDVKLFQPYEVEQILLPDNANCLAVQAFLKMCNLDFQVDPRANAEAMSPSGKVPFIKVGAFVVSELEPIVQFVNNKGITLTGKLEPEEKSDMRAYLSLVHNVLEIAELYICWCDKETYNEVTSVRHGSIYPWPLNHIQNRSKKSSVIKKLKLMNWYKKSLTEVFEEIEICCQALTERLKGREYFFGEKPTELDALVFGHLFTILTTPLPNSHIANTVRNYPLLIGLVQRIERDYFKRETKH